MNTPHTKFKDLGFLLEIAKQEKQHLLGQSPIIESILDMPNYLQNKERILLAYYLPLAQWVNQDIQLVAYTFEQILHLPLGNVQILPTKPKIKTTDSADIDTWRLGLDVVIAGKKNSERKCLKIQIKPMTTEPLAHYISEGYKRRLLEQVLYPIFLGTDIDVQTEIIIDDAKANFQLLDSNHARIGISTRLY